MLQSDYLFHFLSTKETLGSFSFVREALLKFILGSFIFQDILFSASLLARSVMRLARALLFCLKFDLLNL
jgi:hypothetical protein